MSSKYTSHRTAAEAALNAKFHRGLVNMGGDILRLSTAVTPYQHGDLRVRRRVVGTSDGARVEWLSGHAAVQNVGRRNGHPFRNYTTPGTGPRFVQAGLEAATRNIGRYFQ